MGESKLSPEQLGKALEDLKGYANGLERVARDTGLEIDEIEELALDHNVERCPGCDWFFDSHELTPDVDDEPEAETGLCSDCRKDGAP